MKYRLETDSASQPNPRIVPDDNGIPYLAAQQALLAYYIVNANDYLRNAERVSREISNQILSGNTDPW